MATLVAGATGRIGGATLQSLLDLGHQPIAMVRNGARAAAVAYPVETRIADLADPASLDGALASVDTLLLCSGHAPDMLDLQLNALSAARRQGVRRIVKISTSPASAFAGTPSAVAAQHLEVEAALADSGIEYTNVRPNGFTQLLGGFAEELAHGRLNMTLGDAAVSWVDARDVGDVAAAAVLVEGSLPSHIEVTGPQALSGAQLAEILSERTGRPIVYQPISDEAKRDALLAAGAPQWLAEHVVVIFSLLRERDGDRVTDAVPAWTGHPARSVRDVLARDAESLGIAPAVTSEI